MQRVWASVTSQSVGSLPVASLRRFAQRDTTACLAPGATFSSLQEWLRKAVTSPIAAGTVLAANSVAVVLAPSPEPARSAAISWLAGRHRKAFEARSSVASGSLPPTHTRSTFLRSTDTRLMWVNHREAEPYGCREAPEPVGCGP